MNPEELKNITSNLTELTGITDFSFSISSLIAGILFGFIGWWLFRKGRKNSQPKIVGIGVLLMIYPYFTPGPISDWSLGISLCALAYVLWERP
jgi:hypothetical protein